MNPIGAEELSANPSKMSLTILGGRECHLARWKDVKGEEGASYRKVSINMEVRILSINKHGSLVSTQL